MSARQAWLEAISARDTLARMIADRLVEGVQPSAESLDRYRVKQATVDACAVAYDKQLGGGVS